MSELVDQESVQIWMRIGSFERKVNSFVFAVLSRLTEWRDLPTCSDLSIRLPRCLPICEAAREAVDKDWYSSIILSFPNSQARCQFGGGCTYLCFRVLMCRQVFSGPFSDFHTLFQTKLQKWIRSFRPHEVHIT